MTNFEEIQQYSKDLKLLYVEDNKETRESITLMLENFFDNITFGVDGEDGFKKFEKKFNSKKENKQFDLVITDINMPKLNGLEMSEKIKLLDSDIPILIISAFNESEYFNKCIKLGIDGYFLKPLDINTFLLTLSKIVKAIQNTKDAKKHQELLIRYAKQESLTEMLSNIAHHWRQPLSTISAAAGAIEVNNELFISTPADNVKYAQNIIKTTELLSGMIEDFTQVFGDLKKDDIKEISFKKLIKNITNDNDAKYKDIKLISNIEDIYYVEHESLLKDIISPLIQNALEILYGQEKEEKFIFLDIYKLEKNLKIIIKDNGDGINKDIKNKIFEPYITTKHKLFGKGLSLYSVNYIVTNYLKGTICVTNEVYKYNNIEYSGAQFVITLAL